MKNLFIIFILLFIFISCDLIHVNQPYEINLITIALDYQNATNVNNLYGTINDAKEVEKALSLMCERNEVNYTSFNYYQIGYDYSENTINNLEYPSKSHILEGLNKIKKNSKENSINIIYYSGHSDSEGSFILATTDSKEGEIEFNDYTGKIEPHQKITTDELYSAIENYKGQTILISDSCYSGNLYRENPYSIKEKIDLPSLYNKFISQDSNNSNIYILAATEIDNTAHEPFYEVGYRQHGYFTKALLEGLGWCDGVKGELSNEIIDELVDNNGVQGLLAHGLPPAVNNNILSIDSLVEYIEENQEISLNANQNSLAHQYPQVSGGRYDVVLFKY